MAAALLVCAAAASAEEAAGRLTRLTADPALQVTPAVSGTRVAWLDLGSTGQPGIWLADVTDPARPVVERLSASAEAQPPDLSRQLVVWQEQDRLMAFDLAQRVARPIAAGLTLAADPHVWGRRIVWLQEIEAGNIDVVFCDYEPATARCPRQRLTTDPAPDTAADVSDSVIVFQGQRPSEPDEAPPFDTDIYFCDINRYDPANPESCLRRLTGPPVDQVDPAVFGRTIVWTEFLSDAEQDLAHCTLNVSMTECPVVTAATPDNEFDPDVSGSLLVWAQTKENADPRRPRPDISLRNLTTGRTVQVAPFIAMVPDPNDPGRTFPCEVRQEAPAISGLRLVWQDARDTRFETPLCDPFLGADDNIYLFELDFKRGDATLNDTIDVWDAMHMLSHLFLGAGQGCSDACDANDDGRVNIADPIYLLSHLFRAGQPPPAPFPDAGQDPTPDGL